MKKILTFLIILFFLATHALAQEHYISLNKSDNEWSITHGEDVLFHGTGKVDFNNMPSFIKHVVDSLDSVEPKLPARQLRGRAKRNIPISPVIVEPLITTSWHQNAPYNDLMPRINGVHVPAGCATISTAQVINYYRYMQPWTASYDEVYYDGELFQHENVTWYNPSEVQCPEPVWHVEYSSTGWTENIAPAKLCEDIAFAQKAFFDTNETSTNYFTHHDAIRKKFGYLTEIKETTPSSISEVLKEQLDIQRPVIINAADNNNNGHSFIADGYNSEGEFHLNMGWGESWNCWGAPELWAYNQTMFTITLYPDYHDEDLFIRDDEAGTAIFRNLTTGEVFKQDMEENSIIDSYTGLSAHSSFSTSLMLTAGEYDYCVEYKSGKKISAPLPAITNRELYSMYNHYSIDFVNGCSHLNIPYDCKLVFYSQTNIYGFNVILSQFKLDSYSVGNVDFSVSSQESNYNELAPTKYLLSYNGGKYIAKLDNLPAGKYKIFANVHSETIGEFKVGVGAGAIPCEGNNYHEVTLPYNIEGLDWTTFATIEQWTDASNPYVEPLMISLPEHESKGYYKIMLELGVGSDNGLRVNVRWNEINDEQESVIITFYNFNVDYRTYSSFENLDFSNVDGIKAYVASDIDPKNGTVYFTRVNKVAAHEGVLLKGKGNTRYNIPIVKEDLDASENLLIGNQFPRYINSNDKFTNYIFDDNEPGNMDFRICVDSKWISGKSTYLSLPTSDLGDNTVSKFRIILNDEYISLNQQCNDGNKVYRTYSNTSAWVVPEELTVSAVCVDDESISLDNYVTGDIVPANAGVLVSADEGGDYMIELSNEAGTQKPNNALIGTGGGVTAEDMTLLAPGKKYFRLTMHDGTQCGFWWGAENGAGFDLPANQAFLTTDTPISPSITDGYLLIDAKTKQYQLAYIVDGDTISIDSLEHGAIIESLEEPKKEGHTFSGWSEIPETMPAHDVTINGSFTANQYQVSFIVEGDTMLTDYLDFGSAITAPENPTKEGYTFSGWNEIPETMPAHDVTINGSFTANQYQVSFIVEGDTVTTDYLDFGSTITAPVNPTKEGYTFIGWNPMIDENVPAHDATYVAQFTINQYTITFDTDGGSEINPITQDYNTVITTPENPTKTGYTFAGWDREKPSTMPAEDMTIKALWTINQYALIYIIDGDTVQGDSLDFGSEIKPQDTPTKEGHTFSGWSEIPETMPAQDVIVTGTFTVNTYMVRYYVGEELVHEDEIEYGANFTLYEYTPEEGSVFIGWIGETYETMPAHDIEYYADIETGISFVTGNENDNSIYYDLSGHRIQNIKHGGIIIKRLNDGRVVKLLY